MSVPEQRVRALNDAAVAKQGQFVLYWMIANRRCEANFSLDRAVEWATRLSKPLLIFEALNCDYKWASVRLHRFVLQGMRDNQAAAQAAKVSYYPYVEPSPGHGSGLLKQLAEQACVVISDDFPSFFLPQMLQGVAKKLPVLLEAVDSNGLLPMRAADSVFTTAYSFRRYLQQTLQPHLLQLPVPDALSLQEFPRTDCIPPGVLQRWPAADEGLLSADSEQLAQLPIDQQVGPAAFDGGSAAAARTLDRFIRKRLTHYADDRNHPDHDASSGLSPYLHFGHISAHAVFRRLCAEEDWTVEDLADYQDIRGARSGWWGMSPSAEAFLDELVTWRELGYNRCWQTDDYDRLESLPDWARKTLREHAADPRPEIYTREELTHARTSDEIWNAAQTELVRDGRLHNYLRMLWGKKIFEWSETPQQAVDTMVELNNRFAVDGRNPNSYSGIFWVLGRYDRAWGPERPIFGKLRYMTSDSTRRKLKMSEYLQKYTPDPDQARLF